jgi:hypothetical protein
MHLPVTLSPVQETISRDVFSPLNGTLLALLPYVLSSTLGLTYLVAWRCLRHEASPPILLLLSLAATSAFMLSFKALPTHYLLWLCPMATVVLGRSVSNRAVEAAFWVMLLLGAAIPQVWGALYALHSFAVLIMVGRNLAIVTTFLLFLRTALLTSNRDAALQETLSSFETPHRYPVSVAPPR